MKQLYSKLFRRKATQQMTVKIVNFSALIQARQFFEYFFLTWAMGIQYLSYLVRWSVGNTTKVIYVHIITYNDSYFRTASLLLDEMVTIYLKVQQSAL